MRQREKSQKISVHAIAGTNVVLLGLDADESIIDKLLGFAIHCNDQDTKADYWLRGGRVFAEMETPHLYLGKIDSRTAPIQAFLWSDYTALPGHTYTYTVVPIFGDPGELTHVVRAAVQVTVTTEKEDFTEKGKQAEHAVFFNRGVAGSQAYVHMFGDRRKYYLAEQLGHKRWRAFIKPDDVPDRKAWKWLSRGLEEAMLAFIGQAHGPNYAIRASLYELTYPPALDAFAAALESGADVKIIHHSKHKTQTEKKLHDEVLDEVGQAAREAIKRVGFHEPQNADRWLKWNEKAGKWESDVFIERTHTTISHNKFIILLKDGVPIQVWTGSTNFTAGGIFGQSNVGHIIRDEGVAAKYLKYWEQLKDDPKLKELRAWNESFQPDLTGPPPKDPPITPVFSPRPDPPVMLQWYADRLGEAKSSIHFTAAFGVSQEIGEKLVEPKTGRADNPYLSYILLEKKDSPETSKRKKEQAAKQHKPRPLDYYDFTELSQNRVAYGDVLRHRRTGPLSEESLSGLNINVDYLHTKYLLIDPLTDNPTVISGSANFSTNSTIHNDENMLVIQGDTRVADIFLTEFMRLFNHFHIRNWLNPMTDKEYERSINLIPDSSWTRPYFKKGAQEYTERLLFK